MAQLSKIIPLVIMFGCASAVFGDDQGDTTPVDSTKSAGDSVMVTSELDPIPADTISDTLTAAQRAQAAFEARYAKRQQERSDSARVEFSIYDSLLAYFTSQRVNYREQLEQSFFHDAGDYFKFNPGYFVLEPQSTPMRKTVQPFGLAGDRLNLLHEQHLMTPFEHTVEPDGLTDLNDLPTALDHDVFVLPGAVGMILGGSQAIATLVTRPKQSNSTVPESAFLVDKGSFGYSYARGRFSKAFHSGRRIDLSVGYRNADGLVFNRFDDAYHYRADMRFPVTDRLTIVGHARLYNRDGPLHIRPDIGGRQVNRDRFDREAAVSTRFGNDSGTATTEIGYSHQRQSSHLTSGYLAQFDALGHQLFIHRDWVMGAILVRGELSGDFRQYKDDSREFDRLFGRSFLTVAYRSGKSRVGFQAGQQYVESTGSLLSAAAVMTRESSRFTILLSGGFTERAPSLHELYLRRRKASIYATGTLNYADEGNPLLEPERQLTGSANISYGSVDNNLSLEATGGKILDGIDWVTSVQDDGESVFRLFQPQNGDVTFLNVTAAQKVHLSDLLRFNGGGSYHHIEYDNFEKRAYTPEYQAFAGLELHLFWSQKLIHLYGYAEAVYIGPYDGYNTTGLGRELVVNSKLSFSMGDFRFHYIFQNSLANPYEPRENFEIPGWYSSYGFVWNFFN
jgi:hypothetical protein